MIDDIIADRQNRADDEGESALQRCEDNYLEGDE